MADDKAAASTIRVRKYNTKVKANIARLPKKERVEAEEEKKRKQREATARCRENKKKKNL